MAVNGFHVELLTLGESQIVRRMERYEVSAADMSPAFLEVIRYFEGIATRQFNSQGAQSGNPWEALAESTKAYKEKHDLDPRIMHATLELRHSLEESDAPGALRIVSAHQMIYGTTVPQGYWHQKPGDGANYPRRRSIDLTESQKIATMKVLQLFLARGIARRPYAS